MPLAVPRLRAPPRRTRRTESSGCAWTAPGLLDGDWRLLYTAEVAKQGPYAGGDSRIDASYYRLGTGVRHGDYSVRVDREVLTSHDGVYGFQTPLATKHPFQGWADQFLLTPREGIRDTFQVDASKLWVIAIFEL